MSSTTLALSNVVGYVLKDADTSALDRIGEALKSRRNALAAAEIVVNATVTLHGLSPQYLNGLSGVVEEIVPSGKGPRAKVALDKASTNRLAYSSSKYRFLASLDSYDVTVPQSCCKASGG